MSKKKKRFEEASAPGSPPSSAPQSQGWMWKAAIALIVVVLFWRATGYPFVIPGEGSRLLQSAKITGTAQNPAQDWGAAFSAAWEWQPVAWLSHMADFALFGAKADAQRTVSLLLHLLNSILVFSVLRRLTGITMESAITALLFAVHPLRVETVIWLVERRTLLATLFALLALRAYAEFVNGGAQRLWWRGAVFVCTVLAALSHPVGAVVPLLMLLVDVWPLQRQESLATRMAEKAELGLIGLVTIAMAARGAVNPEALWTNGTFDAATRLWHSACGLGLALLKSIAPFSLDQYPALDPPIWAIALVALAVGAAFWSGSRPLVIGVAWFFLAMMPTLGLVHAEISPWRDSGTYLAHVGLLAGLVWFLAAWDRDKLAAIAVCLGLIWTGLAWQRAGEWSIGETLLRHSVERGGHPLAHYQLGQLLLETRRAAESERLLRAVVNAQPGHAESRLLLASALVQSNRRGEAISQVEQAIRLAPQRPGGYLALGFLQTAGGDAAGGARHLGQAIQRGLTTEQEAQAENAIGVYHMNEKRYAEAVQHLERSWKLVPSYASAHANFARALSALGRNRQAFAYLERARLYTKEAPEVLEVWTDVFNKVSAEEKQKSDQEKPQMKKK